MRKALFLKLITNKYILYFNINIFLIRKVRINLSKELSNLLKDRHRWPETFKESKRTFHQSYLHQLKTWWFSALVNILAVFTESRTWDPGISVLVISRESTLRRWGMKENRIGLPQKEAKRMQSPGDSFSSTLVSWRH